MLGWPQHDFTNRFHGYVSADPSVNVCGSALPRAAEPRDWPALRLDTILVAAASATPWSHVAERRHAAALLAAHQGWRDARLVTNALGITPTWVRRLMSQPRPELLAPALLCLGDARLRAGRQGRRALDAAFARPDARPEAVATAPRLRSR